MSKISSANRSFSAEGIVFMALAIAEGVGGEIDGFCELGSGGLGDIEDRADGRLDLLGGETHAPERGHPLGDLLSGKRGLSPEPLGGLGQVLEVGGGRLGDRLDEPHLVIEAGERANGSGEGERERASESEEVFADGGKPREILLESLVEFGALESRFESFLRSSPETSGRFDNPLQDPAFR